VLQVFSVARVEFVKTNKQNVHSSHSHLRSGFADWAGGTRLKVFRAKQLGSLQPKYLASLEEEGQVFLGLNLV